MSEFTLQQQLLAAVEEILPKEEGWKTYIYHAEIPIRRDAVISMHKFRYGTTLYNHSIELPCFVPETNCFPSEKMLNYIGVAPLPTKRAKPRDWIAMAKAAAARVKAHYENLTPL